jgi:hypothetical protein
MTEKQSTQKSQGEIKITADYTGMKICWNGKNVQEMSRKIHNIFKQRNFSNSLKCYANQRLYREKLVQKHRTESITPLTTAFKPVKTKSIGNNALRVNCI